MQQGRSICCYNSDRVLITSGPARGWLARVPLLPNAAADVAAAAAVGGINGFQNFSRVYPARQFENK
jgi:hypothetical protein